MTGFAVVSALVGAVLAFLPVFAVVVLTLAFLREIGRSS